jgi:hypothetical protein
VSKTVEHIVQETTEIVLDGVAFSDTDDIGQVVRATPNSGGRPEYIRLQFDAIGHPRNGETYRWNAPVTGWNSGVSNDPDSEDRWVRE